MLSNLKKDNNDVLFINLKKKYSDVTRLWFFSLECWVILLDLVSYFFIYLLHSSFFKFFLRYFFIKLNINHIKMLF